MFIQIVKAYFVESPLFEIATEDGPGATFNLQVVAETEDGVKYTHCKTFTREESERAETFANVVAHREQINLAYWNRGTSWDHYATPQSYDEEKAEAYFNDGARA